MRTRRSKIARLPFAIREEINRRLLENEPARKIYTWLNALPEVIAVCDEFGEQPIDDRNISDWRLGGFQDWLRRRETVAATKEMADWSIQLAKASGGHLSEGASAILAGQILEVLEDIAKIKTDEGHTPEQLAAIAASVEALTNSLASIRTGDQNNVRLKQNERKLEQRDETIALEREKFQWLTVDAVRKALKDARAKEIESSNVSNEEKIDLMGQHLFGEFWEPAKAGTTSK